MFPPDVPISSFSFPKRNCIGIDPLMRLIWDYFDYLDLNNTVGSCPWRNGRLLPKWVIRCISHNGT